MAVIEGVEMLGTGPFVGCDKLSEVSVIGETHFRVIDGVLFSIEMTRLIWGLPEKSGDYEILSTVKAIDWWTFRSREKLVSITIPDSVNSIGSCAFFKNFGLTSIDIPQSVTFICDLAFFQCESPTSIVLPESITSIGARAFPSCVALESIEIPRSVVEIGEGALTLCSHLKFVSVPEDLEYPLDIFLSYTEITLF